MSIDEIKYEIDVILKSLPEDELRSVLEYLKQVKSLNINDLNLSGNLSKIIKEDSNLLKRLAK